MARQRQQRQNQQRRKRAEAASRRQAGLTQKRAVEAENKAVRLPSGFISIPSTGPATSLRSCLPDALLVLAAVLGVKVPWRALYGQIGPGNLRQNVRFITLAKRTDDGFRGRKSLRGLRFRYAATNTPGGPLVALVRAAAASPVLVLMTIQIDSRAAAESHADEVARVVSAPPATGARRRSRRNKLDALLRQQPPSEDGVEVVSYHAAAAYPEKGGQCGPVRSCPVCRRVRLCHLSSRAGLLPPAPPLPSRPRIHPPAECVTTTTHPGVWIIDRWHSTFISPDEVKDMSRNAGRHHVRCAIERHMGATERGITGLSAYAVTRQGERREPAPLPAAGDKVCVSCDWSGRLGPSSGLDNLGPGAKPYEATVAGAVVRHGLLESVELKFLDKGTRWTEEVSGADFMARAVFGHALETGQSA